MFMIYRTPKRIYEVNYQQISNDMNRVLSNGDDIILDFSDTIYVSSAGIRTLIMGLKTFNAKGYDFCIVNVNPMVKEILDKCGLSKYLIQEDIIQLKKKQNKRV